MAVEVLARRSAYQITAADTGGENKWLSVGLSTVTARQ